MDADWLTALFGDPDLRLRVPVATYRLQFNRSFTFEDARALVPYLAALGISDVYASSYLAARPGSLHGYDLVDHNALNPEIGTDAEYERFVEALRERGMGQILDVVPNHMGIADARNRWWNDVLENGPSSPYAEFFDIDWDPVKRELADKVLLPVLGDQYGRVLEARARPGVRRGVPRAVPRGPAPHRPDPRSRSWVPAGPWRRCSARRTRICRSTGASSPRSETCRAGPRPPRSACRSGCGKKR
jgi:hypothetical protein